ncbi:TIGR04076 family protein [Candidatus Bipolaricaulota bacterium]
MAHVRITVLKCELYQDLLDKHYPPESGDRKRPICPVFSEGQTFDLHPWRFKPEGFCDWAWSDIYRDVTSVAFGVGHPWVSPRPAAVSSCTDGARPVVFKIERVEDEKPGEESEEA